MCLAVPMKITRLLDDDMAEAEIVGNTMRISVRLVPGVRVGDYILAHAGYAIEILHQGEAEEILDLWDVIADVP